VGPGAASLMPAADLGVADADLVNATVSAGLVGAYAVGDLVWRDDNGNGVLDSGEPGLPGIRVELLDEGQQIVGRAVTTGSGRFSFDDLMAGSYRLRFVPPDKNLVFTSARTGTNPAVDSDAAGPAGLSGPVVLGDENPADTTVDAGLTSPANLTVLPVSAEATAAPVDTELSSSLLAARRPPLS
jgi:hypothetical protein